ncbi:zeta toxin family protein [Mucilaginibacter sp. UYCu711]|uniref:zeta toxin family protein n=1 Tax=Mucilaginibacter sp. UYCu711 TaxID=3156339 RepID=UPI003D201A0B
MDYNIPTLFVVSGPNGAGKSTYIKILLPPELKDCKPFDRDKTRSTIENELFGKTTDLTADQKRQSQGDMETILQKEMVKAASEKKHFVLETPLSHPDYWRYIDFFANKGYLVQLSYMCLDSIKDCKMRVSKRVKEGGHNVDVHTIKGVYEMNLKYINEFRDTFKQISLYDGMKKPDLIARLESGNVVRVEPLAFKKSWIKQGLTDIYNDLVRSGKEKSHLGIYKVENDQNQNLGR